MSASHGQEAETHLGADSVAAPVLHGAVLAGGRVDLVPGRPTRRRRLRVTKGETKFTFSYKQLPHLLVILLRIDRDGNT